MDKFHGRLSLIYTLILLYNITNKLHGTYVSDSTTMGQQSQLVHLWCWLLWRSLSALDGTQILLSSLIAFDLDLVVFDFLKGRGKLAHAAVI